jgi:hypothetical protein
MLFSKRWGLHDRSAALPTRSSDLTEKIAGENRRTLSHEDTQGDLPLNEGRFGQTGRNLTFGSGRVTTSFGGRSVSFFTAGKLAPAVWDFFNSIDPTRTLPHRSDCCLYLPSGPFSHHHKFHPAERQKATFRDGRHSFARRAELGCRPSTGK